MLSNASTSITGFTFHISIEATVGRLQQSIQRCKFETNYAVGSRLLKNYSRINTLNVSSLFIDNDSLIIWSLMQTRGKFKLNGMKLKFGLVTTLVIVIATPDFRVPIIFHVHKSIRPFDRAKLKYLSIHIHDVKVPVGFEICFVLPSLHISAFFVVSQIHKLTGIVLAPDVKRTLAHRWGHLIIIIIIIIIIIMMMMMMMMMMIRN